MNLRLPHLLTFLMAISTGLRGEELMSSGLGLLGTIDGRTFSGPSFEIVAGDKALEITAKRGKAKFSVPFDEQTLDDAVLSLNQKAVVVVMNARPWTKHRQTLATVTASGETRICEFDSRRMTYEFGWIVDLGAVSDDGGLVLAKCAFMLPARADGSKWVNHKWAILALKQDVIKVVETDSPIDRWAAVASGKKDSPAEK